MLPSARSSPLLAPLGPTRAVPRTRGSRATRFLPHTAEAARFELARAFTLLAFQASVLDLYTTPPQCEGIAICYKESRTCSILWQIGNNLAH